MNRHCERGISWDGPRCADRTRRAASGWSSPLAGYGVKAMTGLVPPPTTGSVSPTDRSRIGVSTRKSLRIQPGSASATGASNPAKPLSRGTSHCQPGMAMVHPRSSR